MIVAKYRATATGILKFYEGRSKSHTVKIYAANLKRFVSRYRKLERNGDYVEK